VETILMIFS